jgi:aminoglycoside phosphotransferase (APT) family kinase protein
MEIDTTLVRRLLEAQFPQWTALPLRPVPSPGWDNRVFRLGEDMAVRLPSAEAYAAQVAKEHIWLPRLAPLLPLAIPRPLAMGQPGEDYPWPWSIYSWVEGTSAREARIADRRRFATDLAGFLRALQRIEPAGGPPPGDHNCHRGGPLEYYDGETRRAVAALGERIGAFEVIGAWEASLAAGWEGAPVWLHGDFAPGNLLVRDGRLEAVIDFGCCAVGDPACDLAIAWTFLRPDERAAFRAALAPDDGAWTRGRGWALWKALIVLAGLPGNDPAEADNARITLGEVLRDHAAGS